MQLTVSLSENQKRIRNQSGIGEIAAMKKVKRLLSRSKASYNNAAQQSRHRRMVAALSGVSIYSEDFYHFMQRCGKGFYFEFCQDVFRLHTHYSSSLCSQIESRGYDWSSVINVDDEKSGNKQDKYRFDDVLRSVMQTNTMRTHWAEFESKIEGISSFGYHGRIQNVGVLELTLLRIDKVQHRRGSKCNPVVQLGLGNQSYETPMVEDASEVEYNTSFAFHISNIAKQMLWFKVIDFKEYEKSDVLDWLRIDLRTLKDNSNGRKERHLWLKYGGSITVTVKLAMEKPFYYGG